MHLFLDYLQGLAAGKFFCESDCRVPWTRGLIESLLLLLLFLKRESWMPLDRSCGLTSLAFNSINLETMAQWHLLSLPLSAHKLSLSGLYAQMTLHCMCRSNQNLPGNFDTRMQNNQTAKTRNASHKAQKWKTAAFVSQNAQLTQQEEPTIRIARMSGLNGGNFLNMRLICRTKSLLLWNWVRIWRCWMHVL